MTVIYLGNHEAVDYVRATDVNGTHIKDDRDEHVLTRTPLDGKRCTEVHAVTTGTELGGDLTRIWERLSDAPRPAWVATDDPAALDVMAALWPDVEVREPEIEA